MNFYWLVKMDDFQQFLDDNLQFFDLGITDVYGCNFDLSDSGSDSPDPDSSFCKRDKCPNRRLPDQGFCFIHAERVDEKLICRARECRKLAIRSGFCETHYVLTCEFEGCTEPATPRTMRCLAHPVKKSCVVSGCKNPAVFKTPHHKFTHCYEHKTAHDISAIAFACRDPGCDSLARFGQWRDPEPSWCRMHRSKNSENISLNRCEVPGCFEKTTYKFPSKLLCRCDKHAVRGMVSIVERAAPMKRKSSEMEGGCTPFKTPAPEEEA